MVIFFACINAHALIIVTDLVPFKLGKWSLGSGDITADQNICIALRPRGPYSVTVSGDSLGDEFVLVSGSDTIGYRIFFNDRPRLAGRTELEPGVELTGQRGRRLRRRAPCRRPTANLSLIIPEVNIVAAPAGAYVTNISILVSPE